MMFLLKLLGYFALAILVGVALLSAWHNSFFGVCLFLGVVAGLLLQAAKATSSNTKK